MIKQIALGLALGLTSQFAMSAAQPSAKAEIVAIPGVKSVTEVEGLKEYQLTNGLKVVLFPDPSKPRVTVNLTFNVGSRHEGYGEAGMAHLLEHMLFKGTSERPDIWKQLQDRGARFNATTYFDRTNYFETLPAGNGNLEFALALEADRMVNSKIAPEELAKEFSVVRNEFERGENDPTGVLFEQMMNAAYQWHGYGRTTIGNKSDIEQVPPARLKEFYQQYYQPDNALLVVAGSFDEKEALTLINKYFGPIPKPTRTLIPTYTVEPVQEGERTVTLQRNGDQAAVGLAYHTVAGSHPEFPAVQAMTSALTQKPSGLLYKELVEKGHAVEIEADALQLAEPGVIVFVAKVAKGKDPHAVAKRMKDILDKLKPSQFTQTDVTRFQANFSRSFDLAMTDSASIAIYLSEWFSRGDWRLMFLNRDRVDNLTLAQLQGALKYLKPSNRTVGLFIPTKNLDKVAETTPVNVMAALKDYKGRTEVAAGEFFEPTLANVQKRTQYSELPNGMKVALTPKKSRGAPVSFRFDLHVGSEADLKDRLVALHILPRVMLRGTKKHDYLALNDQLALTKTSFNGFATWSLDNPGKIVFSGTTVGPKLDKAIDLATEILMQPSFDPQQFQLVKQEYLAQLKESALDPGDLTNREFMRTLAGVAPSDVRYIPTLEEEIKLVEKLTVNDVKAVYSKLVGASSGQFVAVGDLDAEKLKKQLTASVGQWRSPKGFQPITYQHQPVKAGVITFNTPDKKGANVSVVQALALKDTDPNYPALRIASNILGTGGTSRIFGRLRQKEGLSYGAGGLIRADQQNDLGYLIAYAICAPQNVEKSVAAIREELIKFQKDGVTAEELTNAKQAYAESKKNALMRDASIVEVLSSNMELGRDLSFDIKLDEAIAKVDLAAVNAALKDVVKPDQMTVITALDKKAATEVAKATM
ncbi:M16 family metallopeptidase [Oligoflexus tunisiensis]|uniref:M16 family metallopeptidase n=1 Tax=Oligoflexus tunisiensis TaxID=708132 RepID=UPI000A802017|nr:pitrilysin family protein [Oligoflexus tunisiensis]